MVLLNSKKGLIVGLANDKSIAWGIAQKCHQYGAKLAFTYQNDVLRKRVEPLADSINSDCIIECDVGDNNSIDNTLNQIEEKFGKIDFLVHAVAFANKANLSNNYYDLNRDDFKLAMDISVFSLTVLVKKLIEKSLINNDGKIITLSYYGSEKVIPNYNIMGVAKAALEASVRYLSVDLGKFNIRINSISAGPIKTLASSAIGDFRKILKYNENTSPLNRNVTSEDIGNTAIYLLSDLSSGITGENIHVDCGVSSIGVSKYCLNLISND